jgi:hypothetical protein
VEEALKKGAVEDDGLDSVAVHRGLAGLSPRKNHLDGGMFVDNLVRPVARFALGF